MAEKLEIKKRADGWWITNTPEGVEETGPYDTKQEAVEGRKGLIRFLKEVEDESDE